MPRITVRYRTLLLATLALVAGILSTSACSSEGPSDAGTLTIALTPATMNVVEGGTGSAALTISRGGAFTGRVTLSQSGALSGVIVSFNPERIAAGSTASTLTVTVDAAVVPGNKSITINAAGEHVTTATATLTLGVIAPSTGAFGLVASPAALSLTPGSGPVTSTITITRVAPFTGAVALGVTLNGSPPGINASIDPPSVPGNTATLSVSATTAAVGGTYRAIVHGTGSGVPDATAAVDLTVAPLGGFTVTFCNADAPIWVAAQDGSGAWTRVEPSAGNTYQFAFASGKGGVAVVDTIGSGTVLNVAYGSYGDVFNLVSSVNFAGCGPKVVNGTVANAGQLATISLGSSTATTSPADPAFPAFVLNGVSAGSLSLMASRADAATLTANKIILRRNVNVPNGGTLAPLDFSAGEAFAPGTANVSVTGLGPDEASIASVYVGVFGTRTMGTLSLIQSYTTGAVPYAAIPLSAIGSTLEMQELVAFAEAADPHFVRLAGIFFRTPTDRTITMGPMLSTPTITKLVTAPNVRPQLQLASQSQYDRLISARYDQSSVNRSANVFVTSGYFGALPSTWNIALPDLSAAAGWNPAWGLLDGTPIDWTVSAQGGASEIFDYYLFINEGDEFRTASASSAAPLTLRSWRSGIDPFALQHRLMGLLREESQGRH